MKKVFLLFCLLWVSFTPTYASELDDYILVSEETSQEATQLIVPDDISWTQRFILTELKELRIQNETLRRELNEELNKRELATVDRALSYSGNTVNFLWLIITMAMAGFWLVGWRTMKDVRENLTQNFEKEVQKNVRSQQRKLEEFMQKFEEEQLSQSKEIIQNQEHLQRKQEAAFHWSQFNREEDPVQKLELLDKVWAAGLEEDELLIYVERSSIYVVLWLWDKALETAEKWLELSSENTSLLYTKAEALVMLEETDDALKVINNILVIKPGMKDEILEDATFENLKADIGAMMEELNDK